MRKLLNKLVGVFSGDAAVPSRTADRPPGDGFFKAGGKKKDSTSAKFCAESSRSSISNLDRKRRA
jgi:hypothetical protein